jgi:hypothetical protein
MDITAAISGLEQMRESIDKVLAELRSVPVNPASAPAGLRKICWGKKFTEDEKNALFWIEDQIKLSPDKLTPCMAFETGATFDPAIRNMAGSSGTGLIQFMRPTAIALGTTVEELAKMSRLKQLGYVYKYFKQHGNDLSQWSLEDVYMAILYPAAIGKPLTWNFPWASTSQAYKQNAGLDADKNGEVSKKEATAGVRRMYELGMSDQWYG